MLCAVGLVTFAGVSAARRAAAAWLLLCFASLAVTMLSGALAVGMPSPLFDVVTSTGYLAMLAAGDAGAGRRPRAAGPRGARVEVPLAGVVVSYCLSFGVLSCCSAPGRAAGRW